MSEAFIYDAVRTPRGKNRGGALHGTKPIDLVVGLIDALRERNPDLDDAAIDDIVLGVVSPVGEQGRTSPAPQPGRRSRRIRRRSPGQPVLRLGPRSRQPRRAEGRQRLRIARPRRRVESMSRIPLGSDGGAWAQDPTTNFDTYFVPQGIGADLIATTEGFTRADVDAYAAESQRRAAEAWEDGRFDDSVIPVKDLNGVTILDRDEHMRPGSTVESLAQLPPAFAKLAAQTGFDDVALQKYHWVEEIDHVHTAANSSGIVDGAALVVIGDKEVGERMGMTPRARIVATAVVGSEPTIMLTGPTPATQKVLDKAGLTVDDIDLFELNEAFAAVVLKWMKDLDIPHEKVNVNGGAIAMGHPLGATGAMILGTVLDELERRDLQRGLVTLCIGAGMGIATIIERV